MVKRNRFLAETQKPKQGPPVKAKISEETEILAESLFWPKYTEAKANVTQEMEQRVQWSAPAWAA